MTSPTSFHAVRPERRRRARWRRNLYRIIFEADSRAGRAFDVTLLWAIGLSVVAVMLESVADLRQYYGAELRALEWAFTALFTIEYILRLVSAPRPLRYARSFYGIVDVLAILPTYLSLVVTGTHSLLVIRALRLLRIFRVLKLAQYLEEARMLAAAVMITGFGIIAVPTGLVVSELEQQRRNRITTRTCSHCMRQGHDDDARFCKYCGADLDGH